MRQSILLIIGFLFHSEHSTVLTGIVTIDKEGLAGCEVTVLQNGIAQVTDADGKFRLVAKGLEKLTLAVSYLDGMTCKLFIEDIPSHAGDVDLGTIPLVFNEMVSAADYEKFDSEKKKKYEPLLHWTELNGYINKTSVDTTALRTALWTNRNIKYKYYPVQNKIVVNFKDCRK